MSYYPQFSNTQIPSQYSTIPNQMQFPSPYSSISSPGISSSPQSRQNTNIVWTQGMEGAKSFNVAPGSSAILMDSDADVFYIKSCDSTGKPSLEIFDYKKREPQKPVATVAPSNPDYVLKKDFEKFREEVKSYLKDREVNKHESIIPANDEDIPYGIRER